MDSKLTRWCNGFIEAGWLAAIISAPLFFNIHSERVFEPDKLTIIRSIAVLMAFIWLVRFIDQKGWQQISWLNPRPAGQQSIWKMPFILPIFLLVLIYLISTLFSIAPRISWAGSYQRLQGTYTTLSYIIIFVLTATTIRQRQQVNRLVTAVIMTSIPISLYALLQHFGLDPLPWGGDIQKRVAGHMGNAIFIAAYLIMAVPLTLSRIIDAFTNILTDDDLSYADVIRSSIYIFTLAIQLLAIYWSGSRGPMLGLIVGIFAFILILLVALRNAAVDEKGFGWADVGRAAGMVIGGVAVAYFIISLITSATMTGALASFTAFVAAMGVVAVTIFILVAANRGWRWLWLAWIMLTVVAGLWLGLFNLPEETASQYSDTPLVGNVLETMSEWKALPTIGRFGSILEADSGTGLVRVLIWSGALELLTPSEPLTYPDGTPDAFNALRPLIGYGPETMYVAYNRFYQPELASIEARNASPDRAHNETFDALIITGGAGLLIWQALYLSVFYYGFRWLGVVRTNRDRNLLIGLWVGGATASVLAITQILGAPYFGVALPFGSIIGLILYLIYYALFASASKEEVNPFEVDRLLLMGLLAAVMAHYVEIHFGIAIASTRMHFFIYVALMFLIGFWLPRIKAEAEMPVADNTPRRRRRASSGSTRPGWVAPIFSATFTLSLMIGTLGYEYLNPVITSALQTVEDVPTASEIFRQSLFQNAQEGFIESPFIFLVILLSWGLGALLNLSELAKQNIIRLPSINLKDVKPQGITLSAIIFALLLLISLAIVIVQRSGSLAGASTTALLGLISLLLWSILCLLSMYLLFTKHESGRSFSGISAMLGFIMGLPVMMAGAPIFGLALLIACGVILYLLWDNGWNGFLAPAGLLTILSWAIGMAYTFTHASLLSAAFFAPPVQDPVQQQVLSTNNYAAFLTVFYTFLITLVIIATFFLASKPKPAKESGSILAYLTLIIVAFTGLIIISNTNIQIIQADMVYKRARPLERQARRARTPEAWEFPIAIYEHALERAEQEDFYFLFLGAAYLEQSAVTQDPATQNQLLDRAFDRLQTAQTINPLNTDHTANLARLLTRRAVVNGTTPENQALYISQAAEFYLGAIRLSPRNSTIRNEYGNLVVNLNNDCDAGVAVYQESLAIDPFFINTYLSLANAYEACADTVEGAERLSYFESSADVLEEGFEIANRDQAAIWVNIARSRRRAQQYEAALEAIANAKQLNDPDIASWSFDFEEARIYRDMGDLTLAAEIGAKALEGAPVDNQPQVQQFLDNLETQE